MTHFGGWLSVSWQLGTPVLMQHIGWAGAGSVGRCKQPPGSRSSQAAPGEIAGPHDPAPAPSQSTLGLPPWQLPPHPCPRWWVTASPCAWTTGVILAGAFWITHLPGCPMNGASPGCEVMGWSQRALGRAAQGARHRGWEGGKCKAAFRESWKDCN